MKTGNRESFRLLLEEFSLAQRYPIEGMTKRGSVTTTFFVQRSGSAAMSSDRDAWRRVTNTAAAVASQRTDREDSIVLIPFYPPTEGPT